jgi:hypothetical protein
MAELKGLTSEEILKAWDEMNEFYLENAPDANEYVKIGFFASRIEYMLAEKNGLTLKD